MVRCLLPDSTTVAGECSGWASVLRESPDVVVASADAATVCFRAFGCAFSCWPQGTTSGCSQTTRPVAAGLEDGGAGPAGLAAGLAAAAGGLPEVGSAAP